MVSKINPTNFLVSKLKPKLFITISSSQNIMNKRMRKIITTKRRIKDIGDIFLDTCFDCSNKLSRNVEKFVKSKIDRQVRQDLQQRRRRLSFLPQQVMTKHTKSIFFENFSVLLLKYRYYSAKETLYNLM